MKNAVFFLLLVFLPSYLAAQWFQVTSPTNSTLYNVYFTDVSNGYLSGNTSGVIIKTTNGGNSWSFIPAGQANSTIYDIIFINTQTGFAVGTNKQIIKTTNAGLNWDIRTSGTGIHYCINIPNTVGFAVGGSPTVLDKTTDYGSNWTAIVPPTTNTLKGVYFANSGTGWICGYNGTIMKTTDGCVSWIPQNQLITYNFEKIKFHSLTTGYVIGNSGILMRSTDGGSNWLSIPTGLTSTLYDMYFLNSITGFIVGANGKILKSTDYGINWFSQTTPDNSTTLYHIFMTDANTGYAVGSGGALWKTTNGGGAPIVPFFQKITTGAIATDVAYGHSSAWCDYDNDGYLDLVSSQFNDGCHECTYPIFMYHNNGNETFTKITTGPIVNYIGRTLGVAWGDYDNDNKPDLFVCTWTNENNLLFHNDGNGQFTRILTGSIVNDGGSSVSCSWFDYDRDGWLDLFVVNLYNTANFLYHNNGNGSFTKITSGSIVTDIFYGRSCAVGDYDNDGWPDIFISTYSGQNDVLYHNNQNGTFTRIITGTIVNEGMYGSTCTWGDYDNDMNLDLYVTNSNQTNRLYHNDGNGNFTFMNLIPSQESGWYYGTSMGDYNNDGYLDIVVCSGSGNRLYRNSSGINFIKITNEIVTNENGNNLSLGDYNNDGKLDLFKTSYTTNSLFKNVGATDNYLTIKLHGCLTPTGRSNTSAIGAKIKIRYGNNVQFREIGSVGCGGTLWQYFGLGTVSMIDSIIVFWPSGNIQKLTNVTANQILLIDECLIGINSNQIPVKYELRQNYPNPFNPKTKIEYSIIKRTNVNLKITDLNGKDIITLVNYVQNPGNYKLDFDGTNYSSGIYFYRLETEEFVDTKKMVLIK